MTLEVVLRSEDRPFSTAVLQWGKAPMMPGKLEHLSLILRHPETDRDLAGLLTVEEQAWGTDGENIGASKEKILRRIASFPDGILLAGTMIHNVLEPVGSQYSFRFDWNQDPATLTSWDEYTAHGWTDRVHCSSGNTGFLVGVGVIPHFRQHVFDHNTKHKPMRAAELLIAVTLDNLFGSGVEYILGNARVPCYHLHSQLPIAEYCRMRREDGKLFDPVLRFHERMGAEILKPVRYSLDDPESLNAGCWVIYRHPFEG